ncbi:GntR family transcriptional regulator [Aminiphilus sp.]|jgi:DNA-binding GntR family transcriptional regulator|uniref:GntR family transcriptional regulator n=1 Tax=Aminiphilus sp. TaxID=1872488 RepID=UPI002615D3F7|nr:GntR family transcriptional regulator [Aminiphilus sp.]
MSLMSAEDRAYHQIVERVLSHHFAPGDRIIESELAEALGLSRTPVRNALRKLIAEGLLENRDNRGCFIPKLTPMDMREVFEARISLEGQAAGAAAGRIIPEDVAFLRVLLEREKELYRCGDISGYAAANKDLHLSIASLAKNAYLEKFIRQTYWRSELYVFFFDRFYIPPGGEAPLRDPEKSVSCREHDCIVEAIASKEKEAAATAMSDHLRTTYTLLTRRMPLYHTPACLQPQSGKA